MEYGENQKIGETKEIEGNSGMIGGGYCLTFNHLQAQKQRIYPIFPKT